MIKIINTRLGTCYVVTDDHSGQTLVKTYLEYTAKLFDQHYNQKEHIGVKK